MPVTKPDVDVALNDEALPTNWPVTNITILQSHALKWPEPSFKIKCGPGGAHHFLSDIGYDGGTTDSTKDIIDVTTSNAAPMTLYQSERSGEFTYTIPVHPAPTGYTVRLHFAEFKFAAAGQRKFDVDIDGTPVLSDFDIFAEAGAKDQAVVRDFPHIVPGANSNITIRFYKGSADDAKIDGIEIIPAGS